MVVVVSNRIAVKKGHEEEFEHRWKNRKWAIANSRGFIRTEVLRPVKGDHYIVVSHWQSVKEFEDWTDSDAFMESPRRHASTRSFLRSEPIGDTRSNSGTIARPSIML